MCELPYAGIEMKMALCNRTFESVSVLFELVLLLSLADKTMFVYYHYTLSFSCIELTIIHVLRDNICHFARVPIHKLSEARVFTIGCCYL